MRRALTLFLLLGIPAVLWYAWWLAEYSEYKPFERLEIKSAYFSEREYLAASVLGFDFPDSKKEYREKLSEKTQNVDSLSAEISASFRGKMSFLPFLPIFRACLVNRGFAYSENDRLDSAPDTIGAISFAQEGVREPLYARRGKAVCKTVSKSSFVNNPGSITYGAVGIIEIGPEDKDKLNRGEEARFYVRSYMFDPRDSVIKIGLAWWAFFPFYILILLPAWSYLFFQLEKISRYVVRKPS